MIGTMNLFFYAKITSPREILDLITKSVWLVEFQDKRVKILLLNTQPNSGKGCC